MFWEVSTPRDGGLLSRRGNEELKTCTLKWKKRTFTAKYDHAPTDNDKSIYHVLCLSTADIREDTIMCVHRFQKCNCAYVTVNPNETMVEEETKEWKKCPTHQHERSVMNHQSRLDFYWEQRKSMTCSRMTIEYPANMQKAEAEGDASTGIAVEDFASSSTYQQSYAAAPIDPADRFRRT